MKSLKIVLKNLKEAGIDAAEKLIVDAYGAAQKSLPEIVADPETTSGEKLVASVLIPVVAGFKPAIEKLADLDKDGKVG